MALDNFRAPTLPNAPFNYDVQHMRQLLRVLELYFSQLDSNTPNHAQSYTATVFNGRVKVQNLTTAEKTALIEDVGLIVFDTDLDKLCVCTSGGWETITST